MDCTAKKFQLLLLMALLAHLSGDAGAVASCCAPGSRSCKLYELLCRAGRRNVTRLNNDAAAGILTLGKRKVGERRVQYRLQQLLHASRNQAAGILTMGKRFEDDGHAGVRPSSPVNLCQERPLKHLMPTGRADTDTVQEDSYETR